MTSGTLFDYPAELHQQLTTDEWLNVHLGRAAESPNRTTTVSHAFLKQLRDERDAMQTALEAARQPVSRARSTDPETSHRAAAAPTNLGRWNGQRHRLLQAYEDAHNGYHPTDDLTDEEAGAIAGLAFTRACYWKRCGELRQLGYIEPTGERVSNSGNAVMTCSLTARGRAALDDIGPLPR
jgi:hypothetical protein